MTALQCTTPPALSDYELLTYLDGAADQRTISHIESCASCGERASALARVQQRLASRLHRAPCPDAHSLGEYQLGMLSDTDRLGIDQHLSFCSACVQEITQLQSYLGELRPAIEFSLVENLKVLVARLLPSAGGGLSLSPLAAGLRGAEDGPLVYEAGDVQIVIDLQDDAQGPDHKTLLGLVTGMETGDLRAHLWEQDQLVTSVPIDELGNFVIADLAPTNYELIVTGPALEIHIQTLRV